MKYDRSGTCIKSWEKQKYIPSSSLENVERKVHLGELGIDWRLILKRIVES